jgi:hypothetical protein
VSYNPARLRRVCRDYSIKRCPSSQFSPINKYQHNNRTPRHSTSTTMRHFTSLAALVGLSNLAASQLIDLNYVNALPDPTYIIASDRASETVPYNQNAAIASAIQEATATPVVAPEKRNLAPSRLFRKRNGDCQSVPTTPNVYNAVLDPANLFLSDENLQHQVLTAPSPSGYTRTFQNLKSASQANGYMGYVSYSFFRNMV